jgi:hypothetical protein
MPVAGSVATLAGDAIVQKRLAGKAVARAWNARL